MRPLDLSSRPRMIPSIFRRRLGLYPRILNRCSIPDIILPHRNPVQPPYVLSAFTQLRLAQSFSVCGCETMAVYQSQGFAGRRHAIVLPFELEFALQAHLCLVEAPGAVDGPVSEGSVARTIGKDRIR